jgi:RHS repeat-associated protein
MIVWQRFTGYERDIESELDFAEARYYNPMHGRFTSVDPGGAGAFAENPQTWNAYAYVGNNPINITDPTGLSWYFNKDLNEYRWYGDKDKVGDGFVSVVGSSGQAGSFVYQSVSGEWIGLNPYANNYNSYDNQADATSNFSRIYNCESCQPLADSIAENAETKGRTVKVAAAVAGAAGVCIGTGGIGCAVAKEGAEAIIELELGVPLDLGTMRKRSDKIKGGNTRIFQRRGGASQANVDFDNMNPTGVKNISTQYGPGRVGKLPSGETVIVRPGSSGPGSPPTIEIQRNGRTTDKFRY